MSADLVTFPHLFPLTRLCRSQTAERYGLPNAPNALQTIALANLAWRVLNPLQAALSDRRAFVPGASLSLSSVFRSAAVNRLVGGADDSQHARGEAADFEAFGVSNVELAALVMRTVPFDQLIYEHVSPTDPAAGWLHVSYREGPALNRYEVWRTGPNNRGLAAGAPSWAPGFIPAKDAPGILDPAARR